MAEGSLRMGPLLGLPAVLSELGYQWEPILAESGLDPALFGDPDNTIPFADVGRLLALCVARTHCAHLGLLLGARGGLDSLGLIGTLASCAQNVGSALRGCILYLHLHDRGAVPALWVNGDRAILAYTIVQPDVPGTDLIYDGALVIAHNILGTLSGGGWEPIEVRLHRPRPVDVEPYRRQFRARLIFGAEYAGVVFPSSLLKRPLGGADALMHQEIMRTIEVQEALEAGDLVAQLRRVLRRLMIGGACHEDTCMGQVSSLFAIHRRTLNRRLRAQGTSFKELIDASRYDIARQLLRDTQQPVAEVAAALDYADSAAFTRAFRRWSGSTPAAWRTQVQND